MDKRYTVFVSSTYEDMKEPRDAVIQAIMRQGHIPLGMEAFGAANADSWKVITKTIDASDYYVLLIARRYGSIDQQTDMGWTEREFRYAYEQGVPCLVFLLADTASWPGHLQEREQGGRDRLDAFLAYVRDLRQAAFWLTTHELPYLVMTALGNAFNDDPRLGWVRPAPVAGPGVAEEMARLSQENEEFRQRLAQVDSSSKMERYRIALAKRSFEHNGTALNGQELFYQIAYRIAGDTCEFFDIRKIISKVFNVEDPEDPETDLASRIIDFVSVLGLMKAEAIGKTPATHMASLGGNVSYSYPGHVQNVFILTDEGRNYLAFLVLENSEAHS